jgi:hypothetical protein
LLDADFFVVFGADNSTLTFLQLYISNKNTWLKVNKLPDTNKLLNTRKRLIKWCSERDNERLFISYLHIR